MLTIRLINVCDRLADAIAPQPLSSSYGSIGGAPLDVQRSWQSLKDGEDDNEQFFTPMPPLAAGPDELFQRYMDERRRRGQDDDSPSVPIGSCLVGSPVFDRPEDI